MDETLVSLDGETGAGERAGALRPCSLRPGAKVGRYVLGERLGAGGMGLVFDAHDPQLDRRVAVKLLDAAMSSANVRERWASRMLQEARSLARIRHPNVVEIYDVGRWDGGVFLAMERLSGRTLDVWLAEDSPGHVRICEVFIDVATGLSACHAAGLVHRDLKPSNVMLTDDDRVVVIDFGLAVDLPDTESAVSGPGERSEGGASGDATADGAHIGTPAYMAPEQFEHVVVDARADQFSLCVAWYEALFGRAPFPGRTAIERVAALRTEAPRPPPANTPVPVAVQRALRRGLSPDPAERHPDLDALVASLAPRHRTRWVVGAIAVVATTAVASGYLFADDESVAELVDPCATLEAELDAVWTDARRAQVQRLTAGGSDSVPAMRALSGYADTHRRITAAICGELPADTFDDDPRVRCLRDRVRRLDALLADAEMVNVGLARAVDRLEPLAWCESADVAARALAVPADETRRAEVTKLRNELDRLSFRIGDMGTVQSADALFRRAQELGFAPLQVEAELVLGQSLELANRLEDGIEHLEHCYHDAVEHELHGVAAQAAVRLVVLTGQVRSDYEGSNRWARHAEAALEAMPDPALSASLAERRAAIALLLGHPEDGRDHARRAIEIHRARGLGPTEDLANAYDMLGASEQKLGDYDAAIEAHEKAIAAAREAGASGSLALGRALANASQSYLRRGDLYGALAYATAGYAVLERHIGPDHAAIASLYSIFGVCQEQLKAWDAAAAFHARALRIAEASYGPDHPETARMLSNLATVQVTHGQAAAAKPLVERAVRIRESTLGPDNPQVANSLLVLAQVERGLGDLDAALAAARRAETIVAAMPDRGGVLGDQTATELAIAYGRRGEHDAASRVADAYADRVKTRARPLDVVRAELLRVRLRWLRGDEAGARADARQIVQAWSEDTDPHRDPATLWPIVRELELEALVPAAG